MSATRRVVPIVRTLNVSSYSWATNTLTINTVTPHGLLAGDVVTVVNSEFPETLTDAIGYTDADTFTLACTNSKFKVNPTIETNIFNAAATGAQQTFTFGWNSYPVGMVQVSSNASVTGGNVKVEGSLDGVYWSDAAAAQALSIGAGAKTFDITKPYVYGRLNFTGAVAGTGAKVTAFYVII